MHDETLKYERIEFMCRVWVECIW